MKARSAVPPPAVPRAMPVASRARWALAGLSLAILLAQFGATVVNVGLPMLMQVFNASFAAAQWVVLAYLLVITALIVSVGRLADLWGKRPLFLAGIVVFTLGSTACAAAQGLSWLIAARGVQGLGAAIALSLTMAFVADVVPKSHTGQAMGWLSTVQSIATTLAPTVGGLAIAYVGWRAIFWINIPVGIAAYVLAARYLPASTPQATKPRFDWAGTVVLAAALSAYCLAMTTGQRDGFDDTRTLGLLGGAALALLGFVALQGRSASPLVPLELFRSLPFNASMGINLLVATVMMSTLTLGPFYLSQGLHLSPQRVGGVMSIGPLIAAVIAIPSGRAVDRFGARRTLVAGLGLFTVGVVSMAIAARIDNLASYVVAISVISAGYAFVQTPNNSATMDEAAGGHRATVSSLLNLSRNLGLVSGAALIGAVFAAASDFSSRATATMHAAPAVAHGLEVSFVVDSGLSVASLLLAVLAVRSRAGAAADAGGTPARAGH